MLTLETRSSKSLEHSLTDDIGSWIAPPAIDDERPALPWRDWLKRYMPGYITAPFGDRHIDHWEWWTNLERGVRPRARVEVWPRGGAKSTTIELAASYIGSAERPVRNLLMYVCETQVQADLHVGAIAANLEAVGIGRATNIYGSSKGWKRAEIRAANGFNVIAFGLDAGMRGIKLEEYRPDIIVFDDIDGRHDTPRTTKKKIEVITDTVLGAGSTDVAVLVVQNKIHADSIVSRLVDGRADFLHARMPAIVEPAVRDLQYEQYQDEEGALKYRITGGEATWAGQPISTCEEQMNDIGLSAFLREMQHQVDVIEGALWDRDLINAGRVADVPRDEDGDIDLAKVVVAVDPATTHGENSDETGLAVAGRDRRKQAHAYILEGFGLRVSPHTWARRAIDLAIKHQADEIIAESNQGGEMVRETIRQAARPGEIIPPIRLIHASRGKRLRAEPVVALYEQKRVHHVGSHQTLEEQMCRFTADRDDEDDQVDAMVHAVLGVGITRPRGKITGV